LLEEKGTNYPADKYGMETKYDKIKVKQESTQVFQLLQLPLGTSVPAFDVCFWRLSFKPWYKM
jgi:hypothetical protein